MPQTHTFEVLNIISDTNIVSETNIVYETIIVSETIFVSEKMVLRVVSEGLRGSGCGLATSASVSTS